MQLDSFFCRRQLFCPGVARLARAVASLAVMAALGASAAAGQQAPARNPDRPYLLPQVNRLPDANDQMLMREQQAGAQSFESANAERHKELAAESIELLALAADLRKEMEKTGKDTLSLEVIRKADEIEKLARDVKAKMKLTIGQS
jgi:hypothetical protein